jgi:UDP-GlcNAc:undecaprenyl-phosphate/decaprenyl-phosphate GlcNAc-1-phosphate transferase
VQIISTAFTSVWPLFLWSISLTAFIIFVLYPVSFKVGLVDYPGGRKKHKQAVPLIGGIAIFTSSVVLFCHFIPFQQTYTIFWLTCFILVLLSVMDDLYALRPAGRLITQFLLVCVLVLFGDTAIGNLGNLLGFGNIILNKTSLLFTAFSFVGIINAVNMMDGIDGLSGSVCFVELGCLLFLALQIDAYIEAYIIIIFMGSLLAFLFFNFPSQFSKKRKIFLGDAGSMLMGVTLAWLCVRLTQGQHTGACPPVLMLWVMALPFMDTLHLMINRKMRGLSPFRADRRHIHHILLQLNYSTRETVAILTTVSLLIGASGVWMFLQGLPDYVLFFGMVAMFCFYSRVAYLLKKRVSRRQYKWSRQIGAL